MDASGKTVDVLDGVVPERPPPLRKYRPNNKINTARGPRDRRVRLSPETAIQFYDVQDRLGVQRANEAIDWLIAKSKDSIDKLLINTSSGNYDHPSHPPTPNGGEFEEEDEEEEEDNLNSTPSGYGLMECSALFPQQVQMENDYAQGQNSFYHSSLYEPSFGSLISKEEGLNLYDSISAQSHQYQEESVGFNQGFFHMPAASHNHDESIRDFYN